jgi:protein involved in temperature-dependent protein secretion
MRAPPIRRTLRHNLIDHPVMGLAQAAADALRRLGDLCDRAAWALEAWGERVRDASAPVESPDPGSDPHALGAKAEARHASSLAAGAVVGDGDGKAASPRREAFPETPLVCGVADVADWGAFSGGWLTPTRRPFE